MSATELKIKIPPEIVKFIDKGAPREAKLMAARGMVPMPPQVLLTALTMLSLDGYAEVAAAAKATLLGQEEGMLLKLLAQPTHPRVLEFFLLHKRDNAALLEAILLNRYTPDESVVAVAAQVDERLLLIIAENQERLLRTPKIAEELRRNPAAPQSVIERIMSFLRMSGVLLEGVSSELTREEVQQIMAEDDRAVLNALFNPVEDGDIDDLSVKLFDEEEEDAQKPIEEEDQRSVLRRLSTLTVAQKIRLALKGNKEVRTALIKDSNKIVCTSVVKSPKIQENEVIAIASMRSVNEEVLRLIAANPEWTKNYTLKSNLVANPKCPIPISMQFLKQLRITELGNLAKNKNVSQQLQRAAKQLFDLKR